MDIYLDSLRVQQLPDPFTEPFLLPETDMPRDNTRRIQHYKKALRQGMQHLTSLQQEQIYLHYNGMRKSEIAKRQNSTCSSVSKSIRASMNILRRYITIYMDIFDALEKEFLNDELGGF